MQRPDVLTYWLGRDLDPDRLHRLSDLSFEDCGEISFILRRFRRQRLLLAVTFSLLLAYGVFLGLHLLATLIGPIAGEMQSAEPLSASWSPYQPWITVLALCSGLGVFIRLINKSQWRHTTYEQWLSYLDHQYRSMNNSGALLARRSDTLNVIEKLQKQRTAQFVSQLLNSHQFAVLPATFNHPTKQQFIGLLVIVALLSISDYWRTNTILGEQMVSDIEAKGGVEFIPVNIDDLTVTVTPPDYTGMAEYVSETPSIQLIQGSLVSFELTLNQEVSRAQIQFSDGTKVPMTARGKGVYQAEQLVTQTTTYKFVVDTEFAVQNDIITTQAVVETDGQPTAGNENSAGDNQQSDKSVALPQQMITDSRFTIESISDRAPVIRVANPQQTITPIDMSAEPVVSLDAQVFDDFGVQQVYILASVAKGSGEAVKFRDLEMELDSFELIGSANVDSGFDFNWLHQQLAGNLYDQSAVVSQISVSDSNGSISPRYQLRKTFDLRSLSMEPGDELYFTVVATDRRQPEAQQSRSRTYILRWLDEDSAVLLADGMVLDFIPEYFKSQRQIIIETKQLIADKRLLDEEEFKHTSKQLGFAQGDLKLKYGQYLGDEHEGFEDSSGGSESAHSDHDEHSEHDDHEDHDDGGAGAGASDAFDLTGPGVEHGGEPISGAGHGHSHESFDDGGLGLDKDLSGANELISTFGHAHEDVDVGVYNALDPKALMKMALTYMWQAELELMLHRPEQALPHEEQALAYLTRAQKADRIYVKRLGFEPPPVSEERRYQGDLSDIKDINQLQEVTSDEDSLIALHEKIQMLPADTWSSDSANVLNQLLSVFNQQLQHQPQFISFVSKIQQLQSQQQLAPENCLACWQDIKRQFYRMLPVQDRSLYRQQSFYPLYNKKAKSSEANAASVLFGGMN